MSSLNQIFADVKSASRDLAILSEAKTNSILKSLAAKIVSNIPSLLMENQLDLDRMAKTDPKYDRLKLTNARLKSISNDMKRISDLPSPVGEIIEERISSSNGLRFKKIRVSIGVIGIIYEARPNVTFDVFAICIKSGNACVLKGGSDAEHSNKKILEIIREVLDAHNVNQNIIQLLPSGRSATEELINAVGIVDVIIPRGSQDLINYVRNNARVPVIETGAGIVHAYFDKSGDLVKGADIVFNAKTRRVSVCNALDCLIIHQKRLQDLPKLVERLASKKVLIYADILSYNRLRENYPKNLLEHGSDKHYGIEFLDYKMSIVTVNGLEEALEHINKYSSRHSEAIICEDEQTSELFLNRVDATAVYANASTAFTDGGEFGMGAEMGISTQKLHARGPMGLKEMTSYKWIVEGSGTIRNP